MTSRRQFLLTTGAATLTLALPAQAAQVVTGRAFGSRWRAVVPDGARVAAVRAQIGAVVAQVDAALSPWQPGSEVSRFNTAQGTGWKDASPLLSDVARAAQSIAAETGSFDPSVGPSVARFGFGPIRQGGGTFAALETRADAIRKADPALTLDFCGIAKGHALDLMVAGLRDAGLRDALIELGGEIRALGTHPDGRPWTVAVERPGSRNAIAQHVMQPGALALATSGTLTNGYQGATHLIDPATARPIHNGLTSVSVLAETAMRADALATALIVLGPKTGPALARRRGIAALFVTAENTEIMTGDFAVHVLV